MPPDQPSNLSMNIVTPIEICSQKLEASKHLHLGMISPIKRKTLPEIALIRRIRSGTGTPSFSYKITLASQRTEKAKVKFNSACLKRKKNLCNY